MGHRARYSISEADLIKFLDDLWERYGQYSAIKRNDLEPGKEVDGEMIDRTLVTWDGRRSKRCSSIVQFSVMAAARRITSIVRLELHTKTPDIGEAFAAMGSTAPSLSLNKNSI